MATFTVDYLVEEIAKQYPNLQEKSIKKILDYGFRKLAVIVKRGFDLSLQIDHKNIFIYIPRNPEKQNELMTRQFFRKRYYERRNNK